MYYKRYVDDTFVLFRSPHHLEKLNEYLNTKYADLKFTNEKEVSRSLTFLSVLISFLLQRFIISLHLVEFTPILIVL